MNILNVFFPHFYYVFYNNCRTDAETDRLAMYIIALIKKPLSDDDLKELCLDKLDVFLQDRNGFTF